ncbi:MAG: hypothetical protein JNL01_00560 [Bdellovibrionales bacterium]|nr:hypothetical protein [Bdellovibrionales bacterium]
MPIQSLHDKKLNPVPARSMLIAAQKARPTLLKKHPQLKKVWAQQAPMDLEMLAEFPLFLKSRKLFLKLGGSFNKAVVSCLRSLNTDEVIRKQITYSPIEDELVWIASQKWKKRANEDRAWECVRQFGLVLYHEQNHKILWSLVAPPKDRTPASMRKYVNWCESVVVCLDQLLSDQVGGNFSGILKQLLILYHSAKPYGKDFPISERQRLEVMLVGTYYILQGMTRPLAEEIVLQSFPNLPKAPLKKLARSVVQLNPRFVLETNPKWQYNFLQDVPGRSDAPISFSPPKNFLDTRALIRPLEQVLKHFEVSLK